VAASARANFLSATCEFAPDPALQRQLGACPGVVVTQGFIASDGAGDTVLLGRGGSDTSAAYLAAKLVAQQLEIWTDVPGMFSANPRHTPQARLLRSLHYDEAQEIASSGAKVLHPRCILPAKSQQIPIVVYATQCPQIEGTHISADGGDGAAQVKAVCLKKGITLVSLDSPGMWHEVGFLADAFQVFKRHGLSVDPDLDLGDQCHRVARSGRQLARSAGDRAAVGRSVAAVPCPGDRSVRLREPGRPQHPRHPASARRGLRAVRRAAHLPGEPGRQRSELHLRGG
jgi:hypothetical protein